MKKKGGLSYFYDGGSTWDWSGYDYSDPFYTSNYNDYGYGSGYDTPYYGNNYGYNLGTGYDYDTGDYYSYDPIYSNNDFYDYYYPDFDSDALADNPYYNNAYQAGYYDNSYNYSPYTGSWDSGNYIPYDYYAGSVSPYDYYNSWNPSTQAPYWDSNAPSIPTYDPSLYTDASLPETWNDPTYGAGYVIGSQNDPNMYDDQGNFDPTRDPAKNYASSQSSQPNRFSPTGTQMAGADSSPTQRTPTQAGRTGSNLPQIEDGSNPMDSGIARGRKVEPLQFITARAATGGLMSSGGGIGYNEPSQQPKFMSQGGLQNLYVGGQGDGTSDEVPAMLSNGEFVIPADIVAALGNGSNEAGAGVLDNFLKTVRADKQSPDGELPPDAKSPLEYIQQAKETERS